MSNNIRIRLEENIKKFIETNANEKEFIKMFAIKIDDLVNLVNCMWEYGNISDDEHNDMVAYLYYVYFNYEANERS